MIYDMFVLHEAVFPNVVGIHEKVVYVICISAGGIYTLYFLPEDFIKYAAIVLWLVFFMKTTLDELASHMRNK